MGREGDKGVWRRPAGKVGERGARARGEKRGLGKELHLDLVAPPPISPSVAPPLVSQCKGCWAELNLPDWVGGGWGFGNGGRAAASPKRKKNGGGGGEDGELAYGEEDDAFDPGNASRAKSAGTGQLKGHAACIGGEGGDQ